MHLHSEISAPHVLVVDDDERLRALIVQYISEHDFHVSAAKNTKEAEEILAAFVVDLMILDVMMPGETGLDFMRRKVGDAALPPVLMLTARDEFDDRIAGLESGVADYMAKPFAPRELLLRMQNMLARSREAQAEKIAPLCFGAFRFDKTRSQLFKHGEPVYLTTSEAECLSILAEHAGTALSRERMAQLLGDVTNERSVDVLINRLRKKMETQPSKPVHIQTIRHAGYVLYADQ
jgi:two-component system, OmpR family, phosphate regulon response regulator OmpR